MTRITAPKTRTILLRKFERIHKTCRELKPKSKKSRKDNFAKNLDQVFPLPSTNRKRKADALSDPESHHINNVPTNVTSTSSSQDPCPVVINEDSTSQQSYPDIRDVQDADYSPDSSDIPGDSGPSVESPKVNVSTYLNCRLDFMAGEIARAGVGAETLARVCTKLCEGLYENGKVDQRYVIPRSKLQSTLKRDGEKKIADLAKRKPEAIFVDAKDDRETVICAPSKDGVVRQTKRTVSHYSMVEQPGDSPLGFFVPEKSTGVGIAVGLLEYAKGRNIDLEFWKCIGGDNTNVNSGHTGGFFREVELMIKRVLQRMLCLLHQVELPLRKLFVFYGGTFTAPGTFGGPIGDLIMSDKLPPITTYKRIECNFPRLPDEVLKKMSNDSVMMYKYCVAIDTGKPYLFRANKIDRFVNNKIGPCSTARWITLGTRILRLYMASGSQSYNAHIKEILERLASFIVHVYYKVFANIKLKNRITDAAVHIFDEIRLTREHCQPEEKKVIFESIQHNAFMANPESMVLAMIASEDEEIRNRGVNIIQHVQSSEAFDRYVEEQSGVRRPKKIRKYYVPKLNFDCKGYTNMIITKLEKVKAIPSTGGDNCPIEPPKRLMFLTKQGEFVPVTVPPLICQLSSRDLEALRTTPYVSRIPCHTQSVEHTVALVTRSTKQYRSENTQLANVLQTAAARKDFSGRVSHKRFKQD